MSNYQGNNNRNNNNRSQSSAQTIPPHTPLRDDDYVARAERVIGSLDKRLKLTTSQIRNILAMINQIYNEVILDTQNDQLSEAQKSQIQYLKVKVIYSAGRQEAVMDFVKKAHIQECIDEIKDSKKQFIRFSRYMEALVAYHRFEGGSDK